MSSKALWRRSPFAIFTASDFCQPILSAGYRGRISLAMASPVSFGDAYLIARLAFKIGRAFTKGRKSAPAEFREVENQLYSLSTALYALRKAKDSGTLPSLFADGEDLSGSLHRHHYGNQQDVITEMLGSCNETLRHLDAVVERYSVMTASDDAGERRLKRWSRELKACWKKIEWTKEGGDLGTLRSNLTIHTNSLNLIMSVIYR